VAWRASAVGATGESGGGEGEAETTVFDTFGCNVGDSLPIKAGPRGSVGAGVESNVGARVGDSVPVAVEEDVGTRVGYKPLAGVDADVGDNMCVCVGAGVGFFGGIAVGTGVGEGDAVNVNVCSVVGTLVGAGVGLFVGANVGTDVGFFVVSAVGTGVGGWDGANVNTGGDVSTSVGVSVGLFVGALVGEAEGDADGVGVGWGSGGPSAKNMCTVQRTGQTTPTVFNSICALINVWTHFRRRDTHHCGGPEAFSIPCFTFVDHFLYHVLFATKCAGNFSPVSLSRCTLGNLSAKHRGILPHLEAWITHTPNRGRFTFSGELATDTQHQEYRTTIRYHAVISVINWTFSKQEGTKRGEV
jgi:hypothetical protein